MSEATNKSLVLEDLIIGDPISQHHGVKCCPAIRESTDERFIVKILSIPASSVQLDALLLTGAYPTPAHALEYFKERADEVLREVEVLNRLHAMEGFLPFTSAQIRKSEDGMGYQVYLISPYKRSLERQMQLEPLTHLAAVNLGLDLCAALAICRRAGYLYIDLKPSNVYVIPNQGYRISDLGFIATGSLKYASFPEQFRSPYTAPEITDAMSSLNARLDIYALGLILYQVYNNGELPAQTDGALLPPAYADYEMAEIIMKACNPDPAKRWADPLQMGQAIVSYMQRNSVNDTPIVPPPAEPEPEEPEQPESVEESEAIDPTDAILDGILDGLSEPETDAADESETQEEAASEPEAEETEKVEETAEKAPVDPALDLSFITDATKDETVPSEEDAAEIDENTVSDEVQEMLARADELISHELPEPAVAPEPIEVPFPAPIVTEDVEEGSEEDAEEQVEEEEDGSAVVAPVPEEDSGEFSDDLFEGCCTLPETSAAQPKSEETESDEEEDKQEALGDIPFIPAAQVVDSSDCTVAEYYSDDERPHRKHSRVAKKLIAIFSGIILLAALIVGGYLFYRNYYLQNVDSFIIDGSVDSLTVQINSSINDELLTVVCTDTYGNTRTEDVVNGRVHFANLTPDTQYRVELNISGFHQLTGVTSGSFTTAAQTEILNLTAVAGPEDGSVILSFAVNGPESDTWTVAYSTGNSPETVLNFTGHTVTITGLTVGSEYLFRLIPTSDQYLSGTWLLHYTAQQIVFAQDLTITSCANGILMATWSVPEGSATQTWNVRCYNNDGYDETVTTTDYQAQFTGLDHSYGYTVEVTAVGMTQNVTATVSANPITFSSLTATAEKNNVLKLDWSYSGDAPAEGWILDYTVDGSATVTVSCPENTAQIPLYPGSQYEIDVRPVGDVSCFNGHLSYTAAPAVMFANYNVSAADMSFYMCLTPKKDNWDRFDVPRSDYVETFPVGTKASFLVELWKDRKKSGDEITVTFIIRDSSGIPVTLNNTETTWNNLWNKKFCSLDIPQMPEAPGEYTIDIYFNGQQVNDKTLNFSIT